MKIGFGSDHAAIELKDALLAHLKEQGYECVDFGAYDPNVKTDYPVQGQKVAEAIVSGEIDKGVLVCGTGIGISIAANKVKGVRCGLCTSVEMARLTKQHNNANVLALGGRTTPVDTALEIVDAWLEADFEGGRHQRRVDMLDSI